LHNFKCFKYPITNGLNELSAANRASAIAIATTEAADPMAETLALASASKATATAAAEGVLQSAFPLAAHATPLGARAATAFAAGAIAAAFPTDAAGIADDVVVVAALVALHWAA
jgi:hypothetical protein